MTKPRPIVPVILSGGSGTRLWPLSRSGRPKQLLALTHDRTMLQLTAERTLGEARFAAPIVVANAAHADDVGRQLRDAGIADALVILEPAARNTAAAIALAACATDPQALLLVMPSDHVIADVDAFRAAIGRAVQVVEDGWLATFGIAADAPHTGYGYIRRGAALAPGVHRVERFVEKPDAATAQAYLDAGGYSWNGGIFLFTADAFMTALDAHAPDIARAARRAVELGRSEDGRDGRRLHPDPAAFATAPSVSVDYAVMEKADKVAVVPVEMGWSDIGSWDALHDFATKDEHGNTRFGDVATIDTKNCLIRSDGPLVTTIGIHDLIVVATPDAVLILPKGDSERVKHAVDLLKQRSHQSLHKPFN